MTNPEQIPMAPVIDGAHWPVLIDERTKKVPVPVLNKDVHTRGTRSFGSPRDNGGRRTVGTTLSCASGEALVVAPASGRVLRFGTWQDATWIVYFRTEHCIFGIGGLARGSWEDFQVRADTHLRAGQVLASCSTLSYGVHFQTWARPEALTDNDFIELSRNGRLIWWTAKGAPPLLFNPTEFLVACGGRCVP